MHNVLVDGPNATPHTHLCHMSILFHWHLIVFARLFFFLWFIRRSQKRWVDAILIPPSAESKPNAPYGNYRAIVNFGMLYLAGNLFVSTCSVFTWAQFRHCSKIEIRLLFQITTTTLNLSQLNASLLLMIFRSRPQWTHSTKKGYVRISITHSMNEVG